MDIATLPMVAFMGRNFFPSLCNAGIPTPTELLRCKNLVC
ncbi:hypothetical protein AG1IA_05045 [Rhizoctonia solani AG-1 IA]|uniref:Uncharacterized protein n=1 Tax=Thanatephorus cucumeris (strain AG1-IA) TaxID=983506 RepID=L8WVX1_THACA|nr:hypothetical protein AG1IA_05045 [Rhizoctonia solani AG-1 IA]